MIKIKSIYEARYNFPLCGEHHIVGETEDGRIFYVHGDLWPEDGKVPAEDTFKGNSQISFFDTFDEAYNKYRKYINDIDNYIESYDRLESLDRGSENFGDTF